MKHWHVESYDPSNPHFDSVIDSVYLRYSQLTKRMTDTEARVIAKRLSIAFGIASTWEDECHRQQAMRRVNIANAG